MVRRRNTTLTIKPLTTEAIDELVAQSWLIPGKEGDFRDSLSAREFQAALECCRKRIVDDLVYGGVDTNTPSEVTGYTPCFDAFAALTDYMTDDEYFPLVGFAWVEIDRKRVSPAIVEPLFRPAGRDPAKQDKVMNTAELQVYNALPPIVEVFRGCTRDTADNCSWSRDRNKAVEFARDFAGPIQDPSSDEDQSPVVLRGLCKKCDVLAVFTRWGELEIVVSPFVLTDKQEVWP